MTEWEAPRTASKRWFPRGGLGGSYVPGLPLDEAGQKSAYRKLHPFGSYRVLNAFHRLRPHLSVKGDWLIQSSLDMALVCTVGTSQEVLSVIHFILRGCRPNFGYFSQEFYRPIVRRATMDSDLQDILWRELPNTPNPSERGSFLSLLVSVRGREWCRAECDRKLDGISSSRDGYRYRSHTPGSRICSDSIA
jgi:hypothetical protein